MNLDELADQEIAAVEYANLLGLARREDELARRFLDEPLEVLAEAHATICAGLVAPDVAGRARVNEQDVHDGTQGQVVYRAAAPADIPDLLAGLAAWLGHGSAEKPAAVVAGVVHERILEWQPFEAANGRLARVAARLVRRVRGLDLDAMAVPEREHLADHLGYAREVAATIRRRGDLTRWLERDVEATARALEDAADAAHGTPPPRPPGRAVAALAALGSSFTLADYADEVGASREQARTDLEALERARLVRAEPGTAGLRLRMCASHDGDGS